MMVDFEDKVSEISGILVSFQSREEAIFFISLVLLEA